MLKRFILASVGLLLAASANAADGTYSWQGAYVGGQIGASWGKGEFESYEINKETKTYNQYIWDGHKYIYQPYQYNYLTYDKRNQNFDNSVFVGGIYLGYNFQIKDRFIFGVEADVVWGGDKQNSYSENSFNNRFYSYYINGTTNTSYSDYYRFSSLNSEIESKYKGAFRTRFGYAMDRFLPYVAVGLAFTKVTYTEFGQNIYAYNYVPDYYGNSNNFYSNYTNIASKTMTGYTLGLGTDYALTDNILLRTEYRYTDFGSIYINPYEDSYIGDEGHNVKYKSHDIRLGVAYKF